MLLCFGERLLEQLCESHLQAAPCYGTAAPGSCHRGQPATARVCGAERRVWEKGSWVLWRKCCGGMDVCLFKAALGDAVGPGWE